MEGQRTTTTKKENPMARRKVINQELKEAQALRRRRANLTNQISGSKHPAVKQRLGRELASIDKSVADYERTTRRRK